MMNLLLSLTSSMEADTNKQNRRILKGKTFMAHEELYRDNFLHERGLCLCLLIYSFVVSPLWGHLPRVIVEQAMTGC